MKEKLLLEPQRITAGLIAETKNGGAPEELIFVGARRDRQRRLRADERERRDADSGARRDTRSVGSLRESHVLARLLDDRDLLNAKVSEVMDKSFPVLEMDASFKEIKAKLQKSPRF